MKAFSRSVDSSLFKLPFPGVGCGPNGESNFYTGIYIEKYFISLLFLNNLARNAASSVEASSGKVGSSKFKS